MYNVSAKITALILFYQKKIKEVYLHKILTTRYDTYSLKLLVITKFKIFYFLINDYKNK